MGRRVWAGGTTLAGCKNSVVGICEGNFEDSVLASNGGPRFVSPDGSMVNGISLVLIVG